MCFAYTAIEEKYSYIGSTLHLFGRGDGMNEHGLAVCQAGNGLPVGNFEGAQKAGVTGFSFGSLSAVYWKTAKLWMKRFIGLWMPRLVLISIAVPTVVFTVNPIALFTILLSDPTTAWTLSVR